jgi:CheY-like chemotaxis protein
MTDIVVVDDEIDMLSALAGALEDEGYAVLARSDARVALADIERDPPRLVLLDVMMPALDGIAAAARIRERHPADELPIVLMSAAALEPAARRGAETWQTFLMKPFRLDALLETIGRYVKPSGPRAR